MGKCTHLDNTSLGCILYMSLSHPVLKPCANCSLKIPEYVPFFSCVMTFILVSANKSHNNVDELHYTLCRPRSLSSLFSITQISEAYIVAGPLTQIDQLRHLTHWQLMFCLDPKNCPCDSLSGVMTHWEQHSGVDSLFSALLCFHCIRTTRAWISDECSLAVGS